MTCDPSEDIIRQVRQEWGPRTLLSFSRGKDAIATFLAIRPHFEEVVGYHLFLVPGLEFVEESLDYYRRKLGIRIYNLPHPSFYRQLNEFVFQSPGNAAVILGAKLPNFDYGTIVDMVADEMGLDRDSAMVASGVRAADSPMRRVSLMTHGAISRGKRQYYPVWDFDKARLLRSIEDSGIKLPVDYLAFGRSFDGVDLRFLAPMKKHFPRDYRRVLEWFPLAELELWRAQKFGGLAA